MNTPTDVSLALAALEAQDGRSEADRLWDAGYTLKEIEDLGADTRQLTSGIPTASHVARVEANLVDSALPGETYTDVIDKKSGKVVRLYARRPGSIEAAKQILQHAAPGRHGKNIMLVPVVVVDRMAALRDDAIDSTCAPMLENKSTG